MNQMTRHHFLRVGRDSPRLENKKRAKQRRYLSNAFASYRSPDFYYDCFFSLCFVVVGTRVTMARPCRIAAWVNEQVLSPLLRFSMVPS